MKIRIRNHCYIGEVLVNREVVPQIGMKRIEDGWLPFAIDLREITHIKQTDWDQPDRCSLSAGDRTIIVRGSFKRLLPVWLAAKGCYDRRMQEPEF